MAHNAVVDSVALVSCSGMIINRCLDEARDYYVGARCVEMQREDDGKYYGRGENSYTRQPWEGKTSRDDG